RRSESVRRRTGGQQPHDKGCSKRTIKHNEMKEMKAITHVTKRSIRTIVPSLFIIFALSGLALYPIAQAVVPPPDGGYPNFNTAEGQRALFSLTTGQWNTALGAFTLWKDTDGSYNTAVGTAALLFNVGDQSTARGIENTA